MKASTATIAAALALVTATACLPKPPPLPQCGPYSVVWEARPMPCVPGPGDRVDFIMGTYPTGFITPATPVAVRNAAVARCQAAPLVGAPYWSGAVKINERVLLCRTAVV